jgi:hypothetical protein
LVGLENATSKASMEGIVGMITHFAAGPRTAPRRAAATVGLDIWFELRARLGFEAPLLGELPAAVDDCLLGFQDTRTV